MNNQPSLDVGGATGTDPTGEEPSGSLELTRPRLAQLFLSETSLSSLRRAYRSRAPWRAAIPGFRPDKISRTAFERAALHFAAHPTLFESLIEEFLQERAPGAGTREERLHEAARDERLSTEVRAMLEHAALVPNVGVLPLRGETVALNPDPDETTAPPAMTLASEDDSRSGPTHLASAEISEDQTEATFAADALEWSVVDDDLGEVHSAVAHFERSFVEFFKVCLQKKYGAPWLRQGCGDLRRVWEKRAAERGASSQKTATPVGQAHLGELRDLVILKTNWPVFAPYFPEGPKWFSDQFAQITPVRVSSSHAGERRLSVIEEAAAFAAMIRVVQRYHQQTAEAIRELWTSGSGPTDELVGPASPLITIDDIVLKNFTELPSQWRFLGRESELARLREFWNDKYKTWIQVTGRGGIGKTALVYEFVRELLACPVNDDSPSNPVVAVVLSAKQNYMSGLTDREVLPHQLQLHSVRDVMSAIIETAYGAPTPDADLAVLRSQSLEVTANSQVLVVLDNLEDLSDDSIAEILGLIQDLPRPSKAILTDRLRRGQTNELALNRLDSDSVMVLLGDRLASDGVELVAEDSSPLRELAEAAGGVPLYIHFLANLIRDGHSVLDALAKFRGEGTIGLMQFSFQSSINHFSRDTAEILYVIALEGRVTRNRLRRTVENDDRLADAINELRSAHFVEIVLEGAKTSRFQIADKQLEQYVHLAVPQVLPQERVSFIQQNARTSSDSRRQPEIDIALSQVLAKAEALAADGTLVGWRRAAEFLAHQRGTYGDDPLLLSREGYYEYRLRRSDAARTLLARAEARGASDFRTFLTRGLVEYYDRKWGLAAEYAEKAVKRDPSSEVAQMLLGESLLTEAQHSQAMLASTKTSELLRRARAALDQAVIVRDVYPWQRNHNQRRDQRLEEVESMLAGV